nr:zinc ribbon domain-containing protein [Anaerolineae bacterium]
MPGYEFRCKDCRHVFTFMVDSIADIDQEEPACPRCSSTNLTRLIRKVSVLTNEETRMERWADPSRLSALEDEDPKAMGRLMREMATDMGEDVDPEMHEVIERLESGESPEAIEQSLPPDDGGMGGDLF